MLPKYKIFDVRKNCLAALPATWSDEGPKVDAAKILLEKSLINVSVVMFLQILIG